MIDIYTLLHIGESHENFCEDFLITEELINDRLLLAVMDGCTMGKESSFASMLVGKILRKIVKERFFLNLSETTLIKEQKAILKSLFEHLRVSKNLLLLDKEEMLTTLILMIIDVKKSEGEVIVIGDGCVCINGKVTEFEQDNKPDYLGYHLGENYEEWFSKQTQRIDFQNFTDVSISTDGIWSFSDKIKNQQEFEPINYLFINKSNQENKGMLANKLRRLTDELNNKPLDDLAIIRLIKNG
jgi:serine/threonine protein phosphatase PrpC